MRVNIGIPRIALLGQQVEYGQYLYRAEQENACENNGQFPYFPDIKIGPAAALRDRLQQRESEQKSRDG